MHIIHAKTNVQPKTKVYAAESDNVFDDLDGFEGADLDGEENAAEVAEDMGEDGQQDGSTIEIDNNIFDHLIAECQKCHGIFISAMIASDQDVQSINGVCPLCSKETEQFFIGIIKPYPEDEE